MPRDTVVTIPSQRRNDIIQQDPRHGRNQGTKKVPKLRSGIFYVDDPHEEFRATPTVRDPTLDRFFGDRHMVEHDGDQTSRKSQQKPQNPQSVRYVPVSLLATPPEVHRPQQPYGDIVNKDFNDLFKHQRTKPPRQELPHNMLRKQDENTSRNSVYPLGNPYRRAPVRNVRPPRLQGYLGPPNPWVDNTPHQTINSRTSFSWEPAEPYNVHASGREIDYRQEPVIYHVADSGQLVDPSKVNLQSSTEVGPPPEAPPPVSRLKESSDDAAGGGASPGQYDTQQVPDIPHQGTEHSPWFVG